MKIFYILSFFILNLFGMDLFAQIQQRRSETRVINDLLTKDLDNISFQSPLILSNSIIFFYKGNARSVQIAGDFNNWQNDLFMVESRSNLWTISFTNRIVSGKYRYRLKVDGFWIADPMNPDFEYDIGRQKLSLLVLTNEFRANKKFPYWVSNDIYLFRYKDTNANVVTITGDFNDWNPYSHQLKYKGAGIFEIALKLNPKQIYLYSFIKDGLWVADPNNKKQYRNAQERPVSGFYANYTNSIP